MWWFITYCIIAYLVYTFFYFYLLDSYFEDFYPDQVDTKSRIIVMVVGALSGLMWPIIPIGCLMFLIYILIKKLCQREK